MTTNRRAALVAATAAATLLSLATPASALDLTLGVGVKGGVNGNGALPIPEGQTLTRNDEVYSWSGGFPIFGGGAVGGGFGLVLEGRLEEVWGLETGFYLSFDNMYGYEDIESGGQAFETIEQEQHTTSYRLPLLIKYSAPGMVRPTVGLGAEFVFLSESTLEYTAENRAANADSFNENLDIATSTYTLLMLTFGLELDIEQFRVPLELRLGWNPGFDQDADARLEVEERGGQEVIVYDGAYQFYGALYTGFVYDFDMVLGS